MNVLFLEISNFYVSDYFNNVFFILFLATMLVDVLTGNYVALLQKKWNSRTGLNGTLKHLGILTIVLILLPIISFATGLEYISNTILIYIIWQYTTSVIENISALGYDLNDAFTQYFKYLGKEKDKNAKQDNKGDSK